MLFLCELYVAVMQLIMLNMLLAVVAAANGRVLAKAKLVACYERTKLVLTSEQLLIHQGAHRPDC